VRLEAVAGRGLHERVRGVPPGDEVAERQEAEAVAEAGVVDQDDGSKGSTFRLEATGFEPAWD
jgi:hypothetical protein